MRGITQDTPQGDIVDLRAKGIAVDAGKKGGWAIFKQAAANYRVWMLALTYGACFGVEIFIHNIAASYYVDSFGLSLQSAGFAAGIFGALALFARALGGIFSDRIARAKGLDGRTMFLFACMVGEGVGLLLFSKSPSVGLAIAAMSFFGLFTHMACGATYALMPFVDRKALGGVAGIIGAGGNVGAVVAGFINKASPSTSQTLVGAGPGRARHRLGAPSRSVSRRRTSRRAEAARRSDRAARPRSFARRAGDRLSRAVRQEPERGVERGAPGDRPVMTDVGPFRPRAGMTASANRKRWLALIVVCLGTLMSVLDTTIVNVALPSIRADLGFSETSLVWVINAYMLTLGGFLLLAGRLGDLYGHRRLFIIGIAVFTAASLGCGLATTQSVLVAARAIQGLGGARSRRSRCRLIVHLFDQPADRAKAMGVYGFVCAAGGSIGVLLGGVLTHALSWHWVFLVNLPIGLVVAVSCRTMLPPVPATDAEGRLDIAGSVTVTVALMLAVYAIVDGNQAGWTSTQTIVLLTLAVVAFSAFLAIERRASSPLMPLPLFAIRNVAAANAIGVLWAASMFAWFFISAQYLQLVLGYDARAVGLAFLPSNLVMAVLSVGLSARLVTRFGLRGPLAIGLLCAALGLALSARAPVDGTLWIDVMPGMLLLGLGAGMALNPLILAAMSDVDPSKSGIASGIVNTAFMMGGALGLAVLASLAAARTETVSNGGTATPDALNAGFHVAFAAGAACALAAAAIAFLLIREGPSTVAERGGRMSDDRVG